jgi:hypothetical protein
MTYAFGADFFNCFILNTFCCRIFKGNTSKLRKRNSTEFMLNNKNEAYRLLNKAFTQLDRFKYENSTESFIEVIEK